MDFNTLMENKFLIPAIFVIFFIIYMSYLASQKKESLDNVDKKPEMPFVVTDVPVVVTDVPVVKSDDFKPVEKVSQSNERGNNYAAVEFPKESAQLKSEDLLPKYDEASAFAKENPVSKLLKEQNFLISGYHAGVNTVMQSNKIPYHDLRSAPAIPKQNLGPFLNSSYETFGGSSGRRFFELGA